MRQAGQRNGNEGLPAALRERVLAAEIRLGERLLALDRAVESLRVALARPGDICDAAIHRFELTFELAWKTLRLYLEREGLAPRSPPVYCPRMRDGWRC